MAQMLSAQKSAGRSVLRRWPRRGAYMMGLVAFVVAASVGAWAQSASAQSSLLSAAHCKTLLGERNKLAAAGVAEHLKRGPTWAQANLSAEQIGFVGTFIKLEEQLKFQCPVGFDNLVVAAIRAGRRIAAPPPPLRLPQEMRASRSAKQDAARANRNGTSSRGNRPPLPERNSGRSAQLTDRATGTPRRTTATGLARSRPGPARTQSGGALRGSLTAAPRRPTTQTANRPAPPVPTWRQRAFGGDVTR